MHILEMHKRKLAAVPKLSMVTPPFFHGGLFFPALSGAVILEWVRSCTFQDRGTLESLEKEAAGYIPGASCEFATAHSGATAHSLGATGLKEKSKSTQTTRDLWRVASVSGTDTGSLTRSAILYPWLFRISSHYPSSKVPCAILQVSQTCHKVHLRYFQG